jgi:hypothetical protein
VHLFREPDIISDIRKGRLLWLGQVERMSEDRVKNIPEGKSPLESQERDGWTKMNLIWIKWVLEDAEKQLGVEMMKEAKVLYGPYSQWEEIERDIAHVYVTV